MKSKQQTVKEQGALNKSKTDVKGRGSSAFRLHPSRGAALGLAPNGGVINSRILLLLGFKSVVVVRET